MVFWNRRKSIAVHPLRVHLNGPLQPMHRGRLFEDPLESALLRMGWQVPIVDAGTQMDADYRLAGSDIVFGIPTEGPPARDVLRVVLGGLAELGVPRNSFVELGEDREILGDLRIYTVALSAIAGRDRLDEDNVPRNDEADGLMQRVDLGLGDRGRIRSWEIGDDIALLHVYADSDPDSPKVLGQVVARDPLAARLELSEWTGPTG